MQPFASNVLIEKFGNTQTSGMSAPVEVLVFGSAIVDFICYVERLPKAGETLHGHKFANGFGGKGANQCVAAARLGARTAMVAKLGDDAWGASYLQQLQLEGVQVQHVEKCKGETTGIAQICVTDSGENNIVIVTGANKLLSATDVERAQVLFSNAKILICQQETPLDGTLAALRCFRGISILNAAPALANTPPELLQAASICCVNETEAALMTGNSDITNLAQAKAAVQQLIAMGANIVILTLGAQGAVYAKRTDALKCVHVPAQKVERVVDTTGAGDAFLGALAYYLARYPDAPLHQQIGAACQVAAHSVQFAGTQSSFATDKQLQLDLALLKFDWHEL